jgi:septal ring factor EnvC (AmiA/AmiB activator)
MLILTTLVSLEAIYLSIFIQMAVNKTTASIAGVEKDIDDIQEDVEGLESNVKEITEDISDDEDDDDEIIRTIKDIEARIVKLHKDVAEMNSQKQQL